TSAFVRELGDAQWDALDASGVEAVEIVAPVPQCPLDDHTFLEKTQERLQRSRVRLHSVHLPYGRVQDLSQLDAAARAQALEITACNLRLAAALGATLVVVHPSAEPIADADRGARLDASRESLGRLATVASGEGVRLAVECLPRSCLGNTAVELSSIIEPLDPAVVGICIDVNHLNLREPDIGTAVDRLAPRLLTLHCSENDGIDERHWLPGHEGGVVDWEAFLSALRRGGYAGPFLYEVKAVAPEPSTTLRAIEENFTTVITPLLAN
ncbi:MAG TPA: sugar phosphate isomerase/epimerase family protein, partial [Chloroflexota bacterium]|nr:sugar phosphate isomerase/epimerase family protein [Chloroflexota bacterium]